MSGTWRVGVAGSQLSSIRWAAGMALVLYGIVSMLAAVALGFLSLFLSYLRPRFVPATVVLAIALTTLGAGLFVFAGAGWTMGVGSVVLHWRGVWYSWFLLMPLTVAFLSAVSLAIWYRANTPLRNLRRGLCPACAYPRGESEVCSECGHGVATAGSS